MAERHAFQQLLRFRDPNRPHPIADLLKETPVRVATAAITDHVAVLGLAHPMPFLGPLVRRALFREARKLVRERPDDGPVTALEVWAPQDHGGRLLLAYRTRFEEPLGYPVSALAFGSGLRHYVIPARVGVSLNHPSFLGPPGRLQAMDAGGDADAIVRLPLPLHRRLRTEGVDARSPLPLLIEGLLSVAGFRVDDRMVDDTAVDIHLSYGPASVLVRCDRSVAARVPAYAVDRFGCEFEDHPSDEGAFVSDRPLPYGVQHWQRDPRIHLIGRPKLQRVVDGVACRLIRASVESR